MTGQIVIFKNQRTKQLSALVDLRRKDGVVATWAGLLKETGKSAQKFCADHNLPYESFSRWINGVQEPGWPSINMVMAAFQKEGVAPCPTA